MASSKYPDAQSSPAPASVVREEHIEDAFIAKLRDLKYTDRPDIHDRAALEANTNTRALVDRLLSDDRADKVIVTTIQKLGLALDEGSKHNRQLEKQDREKMSRAKLIGIIEADAKFMDERNAAALAAIAQKHTLNHRAPPSLRGHHPPAHGR